MTDRIFVEILLVEDNKSDAELTLMALEDFHLSNQIVWLKNGKEALDFLFGRGEYEGRDTLQVPKIILLDLKMPKVDGIEVLRAVRSDPKTKFIPVTVLTSSKEDKDIVETYQLGVNSYIVKPVDFDQFVKAVKDVGYYWGILNQHPRKNGNTDS
ncbi:MAG: response regulator [Marinoscillum sp.]|uniref:response regulator n=1 Tax=Marinoscillum sp. TaxID=2024838 RepID=UPI00330193DD